MLLIAARVDRSTIHGLGVFALERIPEGTPVWTFEPRFDQAFSASEFTALPVQAQAHLRHFGYLDAARGRWVLNADLSIFLNHSTTPNTGAPGQEGAAVLTVALRNIEADEELTCDYGTFDAGDKPIAAEGRSS